ncbi:MAG: Butyrate kinase 2 [candidate division WS2 bacterium]|uniref:Probable butyrate kinase n=1 Tax=Psychracetigena formicireducens TaxID=2986056 RepID=A0A9E2F5B6_PSYF1|nr:Butyrate kinase 2 [Candidatus Psychracetigena formicireducens]MBT9144210.1 Butyrate kinase 2 [Candidatus Psychracetigena formicireducens]MBT9150719.1 Butyrate kinase 2 [Candidatus Psychracetigena formicireducens]
MHLILVINPGSTSTKVAIFEDEDGVALKTYRHSSDELKEYVRVIDQIDFRLNLVRSFLEEHSFCLAGFSAVVGVGGLIKPVSGGTYLVNEKMLDDLKVGLQGEHPSNLGGILGHIFASEVGIPAYIVDPVVVDELDELARISGFPEIQRRSIFHALNQKATGRRAAHLLGKEYKEVNLVIAHLGGGISVGAHCQGKVIDVNNALDGDGPFTPERSGGLPVGDLVRLCFSGQYDKSDVLKKITGQGGLVAYLQTNNAQEVESRINKGDSTAQLIYDGMIYQVAKEIGCMATVLKGKVDAVILTGGLSRSKYVVDNIKDRVSYISNVIVYSGEDEMKALAEGVLRVLRGEEETKKYV